MSKSRRTVLSGIVTPLRPEAAAPAPVEAAVAETAATPVLRSVAPIRRRSATKEATIQQTVYLPPAVHDQLRELAFAERVKMHALIMEGLDEVFRRRGLKPIEKLDPKS
jgi:hypothetical protein